MITFEEAQRWVNEAIEALKWSLRLDQYKIIIRYEKLPPGVYGLCTVDPRYQRALIQLDFTEHNNRPELLDTLRHEMLHIFASEFELYRLQVTELTESKSVDAALDVSFSRASESVVYMMEAMLDRQGLTTQKLVTKGK